MQNKKQMKKQVAVNQCGVMINKCCASCKNRVFDDNEMRTCKLTGKHVRGNHVCNCWVMNKGLKCLGCHHGKVQRRDYQLYLLEVRASELEARARGFDVPPASVKSIQRDFELLHGSRFILK